MTSDIGMAVIVVGIVMGAAYIRNIAIELAKIRQIMEGRKPL